VKVRRREREGEGEEERSAANDEEKARHLYTQEEEMKCLRD
jgi:hypothetical protein